MAKIKKVPPVPGRHLVTIGDTQLAVCFDFQAIALFGQVTGINLLDSWAPGKLDALQVSIFAWAGCHRHQPDKDVQWFLDRLNFDNYAEVMTELLKSFSKHMPEPKADPPAPVSEPVSA